MRCIAGLAQLVEHLICNQRVGGSSPSTGTTKLKPPVWAVIFYFLFRLSKNQFANARTPKNLTISFIMIFLFSRRESSIGVFLICVQRLPFSIPWHPLSLNCYCIH